MNSAVKTYGSIFNDTFQNFWHSFGPRWGAFCSAFIESYTVGEVGFDSVNEYRKRIMDFYFKIGGTEVVHLDDQGESEYMTYGYWNWDEIVHELNTKFKDTTLNISEFMKHKTLLQYEDCPLAFYDDFADL